MEKFVIACLAVAGFVFVGWQVSTETGLLETSYKWKRNNLTELANRVRKIRGTGSVSDGIHTMSQAVKINNDDFYLMACDNSSARRNHPNTTYLERSRQRWFTGARSLTGARPWDPPSAKPGVSLNYHSTGDHIESFVAETPKRKYQAPAEEVVWHCIRVVELRKQGVPRDQRIKIMTKEAKTKPWVKW
jgi:hypothetical protein